MGWHEDTPQRFPEDTPRGSLRIPKRFPEDTYPEDTYLHATYPEVTP
jgi:hypothetical protein